MTNSQRRELSSGAATLRRRAVVLAAMGLVVAMLAVASLGVGPVRLSPLAVIDALIGSGGDVAQVIVQQIRLPRAILALAIGGMLGLSGAALQGLLRNPLASPELFGAPQAAAFGAVLMISLGLADEPTAALDARHQLEVMRYLREAADAGTLVIVVTHDLGLAARFADTVLVLAEGRLAAQGAPATALTDTVLADVFRVGAYRAESGGEVVIVPWDAA